MLFSNTHIFLAFRQFQLIHQLMLFVINYHLVANKEEIITINGVETAIKDNFKRFRARSKLQKKRMFNYIRLNKTKFVFLNKYLKKML